jgi:hypothetical protein
MSDCPDFKYHENSDEATEEIRFLRAKVVELEKDAARWQYIIKRNNEWRRFIGDDMDKPYSMLCVRLPFEADLSCRATCEMAIDAAMKESK